MIKRKLFVVLAAVLLTATVPYYSYADEEELILEDSQDYLLEASEETEEKWDQEGYFDDMEESDLLIFEEEEYPVVDDEEGITQSDPVGEEDTEQETEDPFLAEKDTEVLEEFEEDLTEQIEEKASSVIGSGVCGDNLTWELDVEGTLRISGTGEMYDYKIITPAGYWTAVGNSKPPWWDENLLGKIKNIVVENGVTTIGAGAFTCVGIDLDGNDYFNWSGATLEHAFYFESIQLADTLTGIHHHAFQYTGCDLICIPDSVVELDSGSAFTRSGFKYVKLGNGIREIPAGTFKSSEVTHIDWGSSVETIRAEAFYGCRGLTSVTIPDGVSSIGLSAFTSCSNVVEVTVPSSVLAIGDLAFADCTALRNVVLQEGLQELGVSTGGSRVFGGCTSLEKIVIPASVTTIGGNLFNVCTSLKEVTILCPVDTLKYTFKGCTALEYFEIPKTVTSLQSTFSGCENLKSIQIPEGLKEIRYQTFAGCRSLTSVYIPASVTEIDTYRGAFKDTTYPAFEDCYNLKEVLVDPNNPSYASLDGCLYDKEYTKFWYKPEGRTEAVVLPETVNMVHSIGEATFLFKGNIPTGGVNTAEGIGIYNYGKSGLTIYYPEDNFTWSDAARANCSEQVSTWHTWQPDISKCEITLSQTQYTYDGTEKKPGVSLRGGDLTLVQGTDYKVSYANNLAAGNASVTITGIGKYSGTATRTFTIKPKPAVIYQVEASALTGGIISPIGVTNYTAGKSASYTITPNKGYKIQKVVVDGKDVGAKAEYTFTNLQASHTIQAYFVKEHTHVWTTVTDKAATCISSGVQHKECKSCGEKQTSTIIPATGVHKFGTYKVVREATAVEEGQEAAICSVCGERTSRPIKKLTPTIKLNVTSLKLQVKQSSSVLKVSGLAKGDSVSSWSSSNKKIVTVSKKGKLTAKKVGKATITVKLKSGKTGKITVTVQKAKVATTKISGIDNKLTLKKGKKFTLKPILAPLTSQDKITYSTSNKKIASVSSKGVIKGVKKGKAKITVKAGKKKVVVSVTVK